jgi:hypothetical protein
LGKKKEQELLQMAVNEVREGNRAAREFEDQKINLSSKQTEMKSKRLSQFETNKNVRQNLRQLSDDITSQRTFG